MTPTEKHRETAKDIAFDFDCDWTADGRRRGEAEYHAAIEAIATALAKAEREGMKRAAEIAREQANIDWDDGDGGQYGHGYETACGDIAAEIISETGGE